jgi:hypothetical protein
VLVPPNLLARRKVLAVSGRRRRVGDLGDQVGSRGFGDAVDKYSQKGHAN